MVWKSLRNRFVGLLLELFELRTNCLQVGLCALDFVLDLLGISLEVLEVGLLGLKLRFNSHDVCGSALELMPPVLTSDFVGTQLFDCGQAIGNALICSF